MNKKEDKSVKIKEIEYDERELRHGFIEEMERIEKEDDFFEVKDVGKFLKDILTED